MTSGADSQLNGRPLLRRQMDALADWLIKGHWTVREAAALLTGFLPPELGDPRPLGRWLPGRDPEAWPLRDTWDLIVPRDLDRAREWLATISGLGTKESWKVIKLAIKAGIVPPWLPALLESEHAKLLPPSLKAEARTAIEAGPFEPERSRRAHSSYAARPDNWAEAVKEAERLYREGFSNKKVGDLLATQGYGSRSQSAVDRWIREFRRGKTAAEMTAEFRRYRERAGKT